MQGQCHVIPELHRSGGHLRPQGEGIIALNRPLRVQTHHVLVEDFLGLLHPLKALLHLAEVAFLAGLQLPSQKTFDDQLKGYFDWLLFGVAGRDVAFDPDQGEAACQIAERGFIGIRVRLPAALLHLPAHVHGLVVEHHFRIQAVVLEVESDDGAVLGESFRLTPEGFGKTLQKDRKGDVEIRHGTKDAPEARGTDFIHTARTPGNRAMSGFQRCLSFESAGACVSMGHGQTDPRTTNRRGTMGG